MPVTLIPVGPGVPAGTAPPLKSHEDAIRALQEPGEPSACWKIDLATLTAQAPAASYPNHFAIVSDIPALAFSDGTHWYRADTGGVIA